MSDYDARTVEDAMTKIMVKYSDLEERDDGVAMEGKIKDPSFYSEIIFGDPRLTAASPEKEEIRDISYEGIERLLTDEHLHDVGVDPEDTEKVRQEYREAVDAALDGELLGPASAPRDIALEGEDYDE